MEKNIEMMAKYLELPGEKRRSLYNRCAYARRRYGMRWAPYELFVHLNKIAGQRRGLKRPVLSSSDNGWEVSSLIWEEYAFVRQSNWRESIIVGKDKIVDSSYNQDIYGGF